MLRPEFFINKLAESDITCFAGVPDSLLKSFCAYLTDHVDARNHTIAANEGGAVAIAAGHFLATGHPACVYMQNSGEGNAVNPLVSLTDPLVYGIPVLLLIGWRGRPGEHDEPQHSKQGMITTGLLSVLGIRFEVLSKNEAESAIQIGRAVAALQQNEVFALIAEKDTFEEYPCSDKGEDSFSMSREEAIAAVAASLGERDCIVSSTGMISRELFEYRTAMAQGHERDFLTVGSMGHASQIALGIAMAQPDRRVWCFDGDGAAIMHMGGLAIAASRRPDNFIHVVFNNGAHDSVGGQPTVGLQIDLPGVAKAMGYAAIRSVDDSEALSVILNEVKNLSGPVFLEIKVTKGHRKNLGRPTTTPVENKEAFMGFLKR